MSTSIVPFDPVQKAVALSFAELIRKKGNFRGDFPYAYAFYRHAFGVSKPKRSDLLNLSYSSYDTVPEMMRKLDLFLRTNGERSYLVDPYYAKRMFPSLENKNEIRQENHIDMILERRSKIKTKRSEKKLAERTVGLEKLKSEVLKLDKSSLCEWIREKEDEVNEFDLVACLKIWYEKNVNGNWGFDDLYRSMSPSRIALDLSFEDEAVANTDPDEYFF